MPKHFDIARLILAIIKDWKFIFLNCVVASVIAIIYSFFIAEKQFSSSVTFFPPHEEKSILSMLPGGVGGSFFSTDILPQQILTIFESKAIKREIIEKYDFYTKYNLKKSPNKFEQAIKSLKKDLTLSVEEFGTLGVTKHIAYTINFFHTSPDTALLVVNDYFTLLDSVINEVSVDKGKRNRVFIEEQLIKNKHILDSLQKDFELFQKENKVYNIPNQIQLALNSYGQLKAQLLANEVKRKSLLKDYNSSYPTIMALKKEDAVIRSKLAALEKKSKPDVIIGLEKSAEILPQYTNFLREVKVQNKLILLLTQQLEEAKLKEAREFSSLKVIDPPFVPEYKARPKRIFLCVGIVGVYLIFLFSILFLQFFYLEHIKETPLYHEIISIFKRR